MVKRRNRTPLFINSWYIGAGNIIGTFTARSKQPYSKLKEIYGEHLNEFHPNKNTKTIPKLSPKERERIRASLKAELRAHYRKVFLAILISIPFAIGFLYGLGYLIKIVFFPNI